MADGLKPAAIGFIIVGVVTLDAAAWGLIAGFGVLLFIALEVENLAIRRIAARWS